MFKFISSISSLSRRTQRVIVLSTIVTILLAVISYASIPDASGIIHGCYKKNGGTLRVLEDSTTQCSANESPVFWNQAGPQGPVGPQGLAGPQGETGPQGPAGSPGSLPAAAFAVASSPLSYIGSEYTQVMTKDLPAGNWVVTATANIFSNTPTGRREHHCQLRNGSTPIEEVLWIANAEGVWSSTWSMSITGGVAFPQGGQVSVWCRAEEIGEVSGTKMMVVQVGQFLDTAE